MRTLSPRTEPPSRFGPLPSRRPRPKHPRPPTKPSPLSITHLVHGSTSHERAAHQPAEFSPGRITPPSTMLTLSPGGEDGSGSLVRPPCERGFPFHLSRPKSSALTSYMAAKTRVGTQSQERRTAASMPAYSVSRPPGQKRAKRAMLTLMVHPIDTPHLPIILYIDVYNIYIYII